MLQLSIESVECGFHECSCEFEHGIDVIDGHLTEINVTSPTGIRAIKRLGGPDLAVTIWDAIEAKLATNSLVFHGIGTQIV
jgi:hypothetical protein